MEHVRSRSENHPISIKYQYELALFSESKRTREIEQVGEEQDTLAFVFGGGGQMGGRMSSLISKELTYGAMIQVKHVHFYRAVSIT